MMNVTMSSMKTPTLSTRNLCENELRAVEKRAGFSRLFAAIFAALFLCVLFSCLALLAVPPSGAPPRVVAFVWKEHREYSLPNSMRVYEGTAPQNGAAPLRAWRVDIDWNDKNVEARAALSDAPRGKASASSMARKSGAQVAINGGYFDMSSVPARTFSLVQSDARVLAKNIAVVPRGALRFPVTRSAFGIAPDRTLHIDWIAQLGDSIYAYDEAAPHRIDFVAPPPTQSSPRGARLWKMQQALGAGPTLLKNGAPLDSYENEVFWQSGFPRDEPYTRAAIGFTAKNKIVLFATDGRAATRNIGLTLSELTQTLQSLGCTDAMNLDGGGSETLVVNGRAINHPSDGREREITSILGFSARDFAGKTP